MQSSLVVLLVLSIVMSSTVVLAQNDQTPELPIEIFGDNGALDVPSGAYVLSGNVRILRGTLSVFADEARSFNNDSGEIERVELYGEPTRWNDILEDGSEVQGQSDQILYDFISNLITMQGNAEIENVQGQFSGNQLVYDLDTQSLVGDGGVRLLIEPATAASATQQITAASTNPDDDVSTEEAEDDLSAEESVDESSTEDASADEPDDGNG